MKLESSVPASHCLAVNVGGLLRTCLYTYIHQHSHAPLASYLHQLISTTFKMMLFPICTAQRPQLRPTSLDVHPSSVTGGFGQFWAFDSQSGDAKGHHSAHG